MGMYERRRRSGLGVGSGRRPALPCLQMPTHFSSWICHVASSLGCSSWQLALMATRSRNHIRHLPRCLQRPCDLVARRQRLGQKASAGNIHDVSGQQPSAVESLSAADGSLRDATGSHPPGCHLSVLFGFN